MQNALTLASGFIECLLLALAVDAVRRGRRLYAAAVLGMSLVLYGRMADGFISNTAAVAVIAVGLVLAGLTVGADLLFEVVAEAGDEPGEKPSPSV
ncbi:MAG TPA: hypothetical protein VGR61_01385 [Candidatus Dormibacteraeota bacterium]|nr:hypothetical protein [Candidatus Dormibacteraeota bacterium]